MVNFVTAINRCQRNGGGTHISKLDCKSTNKIFVRYSENFNVIGFIFWGSRDTQGTIIATVSLSIGNNFGQISDNGSANSSPLNRPEGAVLW